jgi:membrane protein DedA with SNARE-associated domain
MKASFFMSGFTCATGLLAFSTSHPWIGIGALLAAMVWYVIGKFEEKEMNQK